jgi:hypothetical protein
VLRDVVVGLEVGVADNDLCRQGGAEVWGRSRAQQRRRLGAGCIQAVCSSKQQECEFCNLSFSRCCMPGSRTGAQRFGEEPSTLTCASSHFLAQDNGNRSLQAPGRADRTTQAHHHMHCSLITATGLSGQGGATRPSPLTWYGFCRKSRAMDWTSLGHVADHSSVCLSGRIWSTILRICSRSEVVDSSSEVVNSSSKRGRRLTAPRGGWRMQC